ncbi:MAG TPA: alanine--tRNA ligase [Methylomirabilota bacterium]|nr:alanine--tRNA ligase [Methylomirabilota bacterium]
MTGSEIRQRFLRYFGERDHTVVRSSSLIPRDDPTLLFTNAGMVQFKALFLGEERPEYLRAASCQKCVRAGGKHNDLENVGRTTRHHTFFEMLGNFSFGDYFKREAIQFAWEFLVKDMGLPPERLWMTVYKDDDEAADIWLQGIKVDPKRFGRLGEQSNFWQMGDTGPCGPCSEIFYDHGPGVAGAPPGSPGEEGDRYVEIWNLVFMQFNRDASGNLTPLPKPSVDTGMGLERVAALLQGTRSNFDTDLIRPLITHVERLSRTPYGARVEHDVSMRVIADHARAATFLIADRVTPSNEWRGYVLRRIMRRAMRHGRMLGLSAPFLWEVSGGVVALMGDAYPELREQETRVAETIKLEEERFSETLDIGMAKIREYLEAHGAESGKVVDGKFLFTLYDTYGFPTDLAQEFFEDAGWRLSPESIESFEAEMTAQRERARRSATFGVGEEADAVVVYQRLGAEIPRIEFVGYDSLTSLSRILALVSGAGRTREATAGEEVEIILDRTPAYAESGGQVGDTGTIASAAGRGEIVDTYYRGPQLIVHRVKVVSGGFREGEEVAVSIETPRRQGLRQHHTGTHLLHAALRKLLGTHVAQAGSLVAPDHLRLDFSHPTSLKDREIERIEELVNEQVQANLVVNRLEMPLEEALRSGALALFGEKYGDRVRVIKIGEFSVELCGGTHLDQTGQLGLVKITTEGAVAAGVRRIEAVAGPMALGHVVRAEAALREAAEMLKISPLDVPRRLQKLLEEQHALEKQLSELELRLARARAQELVAAARQVNGVAVIASRVDGLDQEGLRAVADTLRDRLGSGVICIGSVVGDRVNLVAAVTKDLTKRFHAGKLIQEVARAVGGSGGGRPDLAQAGGKEPAKLDQALAGVFDWVARV